MCLYSLASKCGPSPGIPGSLQKLTPLPRPLGPELHCHKPPGGLEPERTCSGTPQLGLANPLWPQTSLHLLEEPEKPSALPPDLLVLPSNTTALRKSIARSAGLGLVRTVKGLRFCLLPGSQGSLSVSWRLPDDRCQMTQDSWVRDRGLYSSSHSKEHEIVK